MDDAHELIGKLLAYDDQTAKKLADDVETLTNSTTYTVDYTGASTIGENNNLSDDFTTIKGANETALATSKVGSVKETVEILTFNVGSGAVVFDVAYVVTTVKTGTSTYNTTLTICLA